MYIHIHTHKGVTLCLQILGDRCSVFSKVVTLYVFKHAPYSDLTSIFIDRNDFREVPRLI